MGVRLVGANPGNAAQVLLLSPALRIDMPSISQRQVEVISVLARALRMTRFAGKVELDVRKR